MLNRVECPKFGHPALSSEFENFELNTEFVAAAKKKNKITIRNLKIFKTNNPFTIFKKIFFPCNNKDFKFTVNVRTFGWVSELRARVPTPHVL